ncbi:MAG: MYXO-CTERM sorting domain-containing protein [Myxococcota bacterium]|nr:MYXO-CTERM sorting domain-containing protein [Myxococcota bacterium]
MKRLVATLAIALAITLILAPRALACSCAAVPFEQLVAGADAIFEARVASVEPVDGMLRAHLDVVQTWREANSEHVVVLTPALESMCGVSFEVGRSYLVLASRDDDGALVASLCGGTRPMEDASEERLALGSGVIPVDIEDREPEESEPQPRQELAPRGGCAGCSVAGGHEGGIAVLVAALALAAIRPRRNR